MKEWLLIPVTLAVFGFGFYIVKKLDAFIAENQRRITVDGHRLDRRMRIAAETPEWLDEISPALAYCSEAAPHLTFFLSCGPSKMILRRLSGGTVDIALLTEASIRHLPPEFHAIHLPRRFAIVWNGHIPCRQRDRVIFSIENELGSLNGEG